MSKKVIIYNDRWCSGGVEALIANILPKMDLSDIELVLLVGQKETNIYDSLLETISCKFIAILDEVCSNPIKRDMMILKRMKKIVSEERPDIVHINVCNSIGFKYAKSIKKCCSCKIIVHSHNTKIQHDKLHIKRMAHKYYKRYEKYSDCNLACSTLAGRFMFKKDFDVLKNGVNYERFAFDSNKRDKIRKQYNIDDKIVLLNVGRYSEQKNQIFLLNILKELIVKNPNYYLLLVGEGEKKDELLAYVKNNKLDAHISFISPVKEIEEYYSASDLFLLPSIHEGLPVTGIETQANGLKSLFSNQISEEVILSDNSILLPIDNVDKWVEAIISMDVSRYEAEDIINKSGYNIKESARKLRKIYDDLLK